MSKVICESMGWEVGTESVCGEKVCAVVVVVVVRAYVRACVRACVGSRNTPAFHNIPGWALIWSTKFWSFTWRWVATTRGTAKSRESIFLTQWQ